MINLSKLPKTILGKKKRLGRGTSSGKGAKSGRGTTRHQKARQDIALTFEGGQGKISKKYPLLRGKARNKSRQRKVFVVTLSDLNKLPENTEVTVEALVKHGIIKDNDIRVKILSSGDLKKALTIKLPVSRKTQEKVEKAGGKIMGV